MATQDQQNQECLRHRLDDEWVREVLGTESKPIQPKDALELAKRLKSRDKFRDARNLLAKVREGGISDPGLQLKLAQQHALCTYKDTGLPKKAKLNRAFKILQKEDNPERTTNQETLGLAGSIFKQKQETNGNVQDLWCSLGYYLRGYEVGPAYDYGYTAINAAFVLDLLADIEAEHSKAAGIKPVGAIALWEKAKVIREHLVRELPSAPLKPGNQWLETEVWYLATLAEAYFGLGQYPEASSWLKKIDISNVPSEEIRSIIRPLVQLASFTRYGEKVPEIAQEVVEEFVGDKETVSSFFTLFKGQKVGLALSGGGFRASLFHLGVLARLADLDILRHIEVLSCVSGGSIIGAHYYLEVRQLLQGKADNENEITKQNYVALVERMAADFLEGAQKNLRTRVYSNPWFILKMLWSRSYSRTLRLGELFEKFIYAKVEGGKPKNPLLLNEMTITPLDRQGQPHTGFHPNRHNWNRRNKVPALILNATTLNTGNTWQFTATYMGEPRIGDTFTDGSDRLRRFYYNEASTPEAYKNIRLGHAVAASACVPGLFEPVTFRNLYDGKTVQLVDGGVYDNQGVESLLEQDCTRILVSDASGQLRAENEPSAGPISVPLRASSILQNRVRNTLYQNYDSRGRASLLQLLMSVHLKQGLTTQPIPWRGCKDIADIDWEPLRPEDYPLPYDILETVQQKLSQIRTDLDSFSEKEAYALMTSGYYMAKKQLADTTKEFSDLKEPHPWEFLKIDPQMTKKAQSSALEQLLDVGQHRFFKVWKTSQPLRALSFGVLLAIVFAMGWMGYTHMGEVFLSNRLNLLGMSFDQTLTWGGVALLLVAMIVYPILGKLGFRPNELLSRWAIGLGMGLVGWLPAAIHVYVFDRFFLDGGRLDPHTQPTEGSGVSDPATSELTMKG